VLTDIKSLTREEIEAQFKLWEQPVYRVTQLLEWLYVRHVTSWDAMTNLPKKLRASLQQNYSLQALELVRKQGSRDITQKFLWKLATARSSKVFDPGQSRALRRGERPPHAVRLHAGRLRLRLQILRERPRRLEAQSCTE